MTTHPESTVRRIVLALETAEPTGEMLDFALGLARHFSAELIALMVANDALLRAASLPFAVEIDRHTASERRLDAAMLERLFRRHAEQVRELLQARTQASGVEFQIHSVRGDPLDAPLAHSLASDLLVFDRRGRAPGAALASRRILLDTESADGDALQQAARVLEQPLGRGTAERMPWSGDARSLARLRRAQPTLVLARVPADGTAAGWLRSLLGALECPIVLQR